MLLTQRALQKELRIQIQLPQDWVSPRVILFKMQSKYAKAKLDYLDSLFHDFENQRLDDYTKSHIAKYLTVLCSGIFEDIFKSFILELSSKDTIRKEIKEF